VALGMVTAVGAAAAQPHRLPGAAGPRVEMLAPLPPGHELLDIAVYAAQEEVSARSRVQRFPAGTPRLTLAIGLNRLPREGMRLRYDLETTTGAVALADGVASFVPADRGGARVEFELVPKGRRFVPGPYRLAISMDDEPRIALNFSIEEE
jgi:hypothetical protein